MRLPANSTVNDPYQRRWDQYPEEAYRRPCRSVTVQLYTSLIFKGPEVVEEINSGLIDLISGDGYTSITEAIGVDRR